MTRRHAIDEEPRCEHGLRVSDCSPCADAEERGTKWSPIWAAAFMACLERRESQR